MIEHPEILQLPERERAFLERWWKERSKGLFAGELQARIGRISREIKEQTDRGAGIIGVAVLEDRLRSLLATQLVAGFKPAKFPTATFANLISACEGLGLIGPVAAADLRVLKEIRNNFAHRADPIDFADSQIASDCGKLRLARLAFFGEKDYDGNWTSLGLDEPRRVFLNAVTVILEGVAIQELLQAGEPRPEPFLI